MHSNLLPGLDFKIGGATAGGATVVNLDMTLQSGVHSLVGVVQFGAISITTNTPPQVLLQHADVADYSDAETIADLTQTIVAGMANKKVLVECVHPTKKYVRLSVVRTGASNSIAITEQMIIANYGRVLPVPLASDDFVRDYAACPASA